jgi:hypothetical protein
MVREKVDKTLNMLTELSNYHEELNLENIREAFADEHMNYPVTCKKAGKYDLNRVMTYEGRISVICRDILYYS